MKWAVSWFIAFLLFLEVTPRCDLGRAAESFPEMGTRALLGLVGLVGLGHRHYWAQAGGTAQSFTTTIKEADDRTPHLVIANCNCYSSSMFPVDFFLKNC